MKKVLCKKVEKIWGYELWIYSPVKGSETLMEDGSPVTEGPLIKIIKANMPLSVQVHPDDAMAQEVEHYPNGKAESWMVLEAGPSAELIIGLKNYDKNTILKQLEDKTFENNLLKIKPKASEFINIPAGLVHGIGADITVFEVQQPSDTTYRYFDYNRLENGKPRELHVEKALMAQKDISWKLEPVCKDPLTYKTITGTQAFYKKATKIEKRAIVVDLKNYQAYIAENEEACFPYFAVVSI